MKKQYSYAFALGIFIGLALTSNTKADEQQMVRQPRQKRSCQEKAHEVRKKVLMKCQKHRAEFGKQIRYKHSCEQIADHVSSKVLSRCKKHRAQKADAQDRKQDKRSRRSNSTQAISQQIPVMQAPAYYNTGIVSPHILPYREEANVVEITEPIVDIL
ncbi:hypothetical protein JST99_03565 [Candidatus Dependentiae bacterium]|nr:hypothetical protein [Candidatus Dependentiae bacterium]MCC7414880.1 hypothetical protein [Campylobacterota bacterium]